MGRSPCCEKSHTNKGAWSKEEDDRLVSYIRDHGEGSWRSLPKSAGLARCGKSCRLRWINYLRPDLKRGNFTEEEDNLIIKLHSYIGNKWSLIASRLPGRTDNEIKNYWNTHIKRKLVNQGLDPQSHRPLNSSPFPTSQSTHRESNNHVNQSPNATVPKPEPNAMSAFSAPDDGNSNSGTTIEAELLERDKSSDVLDLELSVGLKPFRSPMLACSCWPGFHTVGRCCGKCEPSKNRVIQGNAIFSSSSSFSCNDKTSNSATSMLYSKMDNNYGTFV